MRRCWSPRGLVLIFLSLAFYLSSSTASIEKYRVTEERQRQLQEEKGRVHCSRSRSRTARTIISECRYCKKVFRSREFLDTHFDNRHSEKLDTDSNRCLADICGAVHCDYFNSLSSQLKKQATCKPAVMEKNRLSCEVLANTCFPVEQSQVAQRLNGAKLLTLEMYIIEILFCDSHTCKKKLKIFPRGSGINRNKSLFYALSLFTLFSLAVFYLVMYLHTRENRLLIKGLKRASTRPAIKSQKD